MHSLVKRLEDQIARGAKPLSVKIVISCLSESAEGLVFSE